jgi:2-polyprenyl-3-methyl-5-hydroxy-6-metoxy-1,4-benzoquinol methylase
MTAYRDQLYTNYTSTQENRSGENESQLFAQQVFYFTKELVPLLPKNKQATILDIGCGNGAMLKAVANSGYAHAQGIDLSPEQIKTAHAMGLTNVSCIGVDDFLNAHNGGFDLIMAIDVIEHFTKSELVEYLNKIKKALNSGGMVLFRTPNMDAPLTSVYSYGDFTHECLLNKSSAEQVMASAGFIQIEVLPSMILAQGFIKETLRKITWSCVQFWLKVMLFASGRTWNGVVFTPNLVIKAKVK